VLREEIADAEGNEVFALGWLNEEGLVSRITVAARGNIDAVLAPDKGTGKPGFEALGDGAPDVYIHNHPSGSLSPSDNDLLIAARAAEEGIGSFIVDNGLERVYGICEPVKRRKKALLDRAEITGALEEGGAVARRLPAYESRAAQLDLMGLIIRSFNEDALVAAEAGTGVGKSFAYLLPAVQFALANDERIVISTATITLQQQLFDKDIPLVKKALDADIKAVLMKGRGNYVCLRRLEDAAATAAIEQFLDPEEAASLQAISQWAKTSPTGSRSDLGFLPPEGLWSRICSDAEACLGMRCPRREACFVMILRRESADARIIVVNHHLLFADLAARYESGSYDASIVLPPYSRVILDEAHKVEEAATGFFSREMSRLGIYQQLGRLYRRKKGGAQTGLLPRLAKFLPPGQVSRFLGPEGDRVFDLTQQIREAADSLDQAALELCAGSGVFRLIPARDAIIGQFLAPGILSLRRQIIALGTLVRDMLEGADKDAEKDPSYESTVWEVKSVLRRLAKTASVCTAFLEYKEKPDEVLWLERQRSRRREDSDWVIFSETPLDVAPILRESLFDTSETVVCLSATLSVGGTFDYWGLRSGFSLAEDRKRLTGIFPSPFPYRDSVLLAIPRDGPLPQEEGFGPFVDRAAAALAECSGGSALLLFTSYDSLLNAWKAARPLLEDQGIRVLKQGDEDRSRLLADFLADEKSVLFATDSFWEGVDAPGDTLRLVVLCRLPFRTPSEPVFEARCERLEAQGGNAFMDLSLPEAVMKFKQGFGRLMRRSSDHGVVAVLDGRILKKRYGRFFLQSLPETRTCFGTLKEVLRTMEEFL